MKKRVICVRTCIVREGSVLYGSKDGKRTITSPEEAAEFAASFFKGSDKEMMHFKDAVSKGKNRERAREQQKDRGQSL